MAQTSSRRSPSSSAPAGGVAPLLRRLALLAIWGVVLVAPLAFMPSLQEAFRLPTLLASEGLGLASLVLLALAEALGGGRASERAAAGGGEAESRPLWRSPVVMALLPLLLVASLGLWTSDHGEHVRRALPDLWIGAACLVGWALALERRELERLLVGLALPAGVMALLGLLQAYDLYRPFDFAGGAEGQRVGITSLAGNAGDLASYLVLPLLIAQWQGTRHWRSTEPDGGRPWLRLLAWALLAVLCAWGLVMTQTVTAILALGAASAVFWLGILTPRRRLVAGALGSVVLVAAALGPTPLRDRFESVSERASAGRLNAALSGRLDGWWAALRMVEGHPWTGIGHGAYRAEFAPAKLALQAEGRRFYRGHNEPFFANAHNELLEVAAEWGLPGLLALVWALALLGWRGLRPLAGAPTGAAAGATAGALSEAVARRSFAAAALAGLLVLALAHFPFRQALVAYPALLLLAWVMAAGREGEALQAEEMQAEEMSSTEEAP